MVIPTKRDLWRLPLDSVRWRNFNLTPSTLFTFKVKNFYASPPSSVFPSLPQNDLSNGTPIEHVLVRCPRPPEGGQLGGLPHRATPVSAPRSSQGGTEPYTQPASYSKIGSHIHTPFPSYPRTERMCQREHGADDMKGTPEAAFKG